MQAPPPWRIDEESQRMTLEVKTKDFLDALDLFRRVGEVAEALDHHPDLHLERWNRVRLVTFSHDVGRLTERDERLARRLVEALREGGWLGTD